MSADPNQTPATPPPMPATAAAAADAPLQFDRAEFAGETALTCASCKTPITDEYYQINGQTICAKCRTQITAFFAGGSKASRFLRAAAAGIGAGFVGFLIYWVILEVTNINFGLVAILVGWMVGSAVRWGSNRLGGRFYQLLAVAITYVAICATYIPMVFRDPDLAKSSFITKFIVASVYSLIAPWINGFDIIGWVIIGFGLLQAWQMNRALKLDVSGPFFARQSSPPAAP
jgi:hypothetical protein